MGAEAMDVGVGLRRVTVVSRNAVYGGPECRELMWCGLRGGEYMGDMVWIQPDRVLWCWGCRVGAVSRYRDGGYGVGGQRVTGSWSEANVSGGCGVGGCCEVRWEDMMGGGIGKGSVGIAE